MTQIRVEELEHSEYLAFNPESSPKDIMRDMMEKQVTEAYVVDNENTLVGKINIVSLIEDTESIMNIIDKTPVALQTTNSLTEALEIASDFVGESIPIVKGNKLEGAITEGDLFTKVLAIQDDLRNEETEGNGVTG